MPFTSIYSTDPRTNPAQFREKILRIDGFEKRSRNFDDYPGFQPMRSWANTYAQDCRLSTTHLTLIYKLEIAIRIFSNLVSMLQNVFGIGYKPVRSKNSKSNLGLQVSQVHYQNHRWHCIILFTGISKLTANFLLLNSSNLYFIKVLTSYQQSKILKSAIFELPK